MYFFWLPSPDIAIARVAARVKRGGHFVEDEVVRRRHGRGVKNFFALYRPIVTHWEFFDSSQPGMPRRLAEGNREEQIIVHDNAIWGKIVEEYDRPS